jgi:integrating conjugative element protein (TIGR03746 family)
MTVNPFQLWAKEDRDRRVIQVLIVVIIGLMLSNVGLWMGWLRAPKQLTVFVPPDLSAAVVQSVDDVPAHSVYVFAYLVWQELNYWPTQEMDGQGRYAYMRNLERLRAYLTPAFHAQLLRDATALQRQGHLNRTRFMEGLQGASFKPELVQKLAPGEWLVWLDVRLTETAQQWPVKDTSIRYPLRVIYRDVSRSHNPYGLLLAGFSQPPSRIEEAS